MSQSWGCEFLDLDSYWTSDSPSETSETLTAPSRYPSYDYRMIHRDIVIACAQPNQLQRCYTTDLQLTNNIRIQIQKEGLKRPLELLVDDNGRMVLRDGHHRLAATDHDPEYEYLPCTFKFVEQLKANGAQKISGFLLGMLDRF